MRMYLMASLIVVANAAGADAGPLRNWLNRSHARQVAVVRTRTVVRTSETAIAAAAPCQSCSAAAARAPVAIQTAAAVAPVISGVIAQAKAQAQANVGRVFHTGAVPAGCVEGVGYSSSSAGQALAMCCYSNSGLRIREQAVVRGAGGWYACRIFWK